MVRNAYAAGEADQIAQTFSGTEAHVRERLAAHLHELEHAGHEVAEGARRALSPRHDAEDQDQDQDEDEGWASDGEPAQDAEPRTRSRSPRVKPAPSKPASAKPGRRRNSMRKGMFGRAHLAKQRGAEDAVAEEADDARRGRGGPADAGSLRSRLDGLRQREASPARSVRWADGGEGAQSRSGEDTPNRSGTSTPRVSILHDASAPASASPHQNSFEEAKGRVTFDLP